MTPFALLFFSIEPLVVLGILFRAAHRAGLTLRTVIIGATIFHESVLVAFPIWYSVFTDYYLEREINASPDRLLEIMIGEAVFAILFGISMSFVKTRTAKPWQTTLSAKSNRAERLMVILLGSLGLLINLWGFSRPVETLGGPYNILRS